MIKKFNEYYADLTYNNFKEQKSINTIISDEEIEDQFLRLKEVLNCQIKWILDWSDQITKPNSAAIRILVIPEKFVKKFNIFQSRKNFKKYIKSIISEINNIKNRMESMYTNIEIIIYDGYPTDGKINYDMDLNNSIEIKMYLKKDKKI